MRLNILKDGIYNNEQGQAVACEAKEVFITSQAYGQLLIDDGFAEELAEPQSEIQTAEGEDAPKVEAPQKGRSSRSGRNNAFAPK
jgi:hypothetical protein